MGVAVLHRYRIGLCSQCCLFFRGGNIHFCTLVLELGLYDIAVELLLLSLLLSLFQTVGVEACVAVSLAQASCTVS
jgi:hypothetical protein